MLKVMIAIQGSARSAIAEGTALCAIARFRSRSVSLRDSYQVRLNTYDYLNNPTPVKLRYG
jgi:hypothetical protein